MTVYGRIEVQASLGHAVVRDVKTGETIRFTPSEWLPFIQGVKAGEFDPKAAGGA